MPRQPRFFSPGVPLHVIQRGNDRQSIFRDPDDRLRFLTLLRQAIRRHGVSIHAYVLMTNHVHFLLTPLGRDGVAGVMQSVGRVYVRWFNGRYRRTGTLWEGRYKATVVEDERYLLTCMRYIELNPVRARMVTTPDEHPWSSFAANACGEASDLVEPHPVYRALGAAPDQRRGAYRELFRHEIPEVDLCAIRDATQCGWALGGAGFRARIDATGRRASRLPMGRPRKRREPDPE
jgi:putative transposase